MGVRPRIAIIGGVAAGPAAAAQAKRTDPKAEVVLFEQGTTISYGACEIPYYVSDQIPQSETLVILSPDQFTRTRGVTVHTRHRVLGLNPIRNRLTVERLADGHVREERFDKFILATGARPHLPDIEGIDASNVFPVRTLDDAIHIKAFLNQQTVHHAVILGGGPIGVEMAEALRAQQVRATILEPNGVLHTLLDAPMRMHVNATLHAQGITVRDERATAFARHRDGSVQAIHTDQGEKIGCQMVIVATGIRPNTDLATHARLKTDRWGAFAVDAHMRTNQSNVWACGDCVSVERVIDQRKVYQPLAPVAFRTARVAGHNAARRGRGAVMRYPGVCGSIGVKVFDLEVAAVGLRLDEAQDAGIDAEVTAITHWSRAQIYPGAQPLHVQLVWARRTGRLLGAALVGTEGAVHRANTLLPLLRSRATVFDLWDVDLIYTPPFAPSLDPLLVAANEAAKACKAIR